MKPNFKDINIKTATPQPNTAEWNATNHIEKNWNTPEQIPVKPVYTKEDLEGMEHLHYAAGLAPYLAVARHVGLHLRSVADYPQPNRKYGWFFRPITTER